MWKECSALRPIHVLPDCEFGTKVIDITLLPCSELLVRFKPLLRSQLYKPITRSGFEEYNLKAVE